MRSRFPRRSGGEEKVAHEESLARSPFVRPELPIAGSLPGHDQAKNRSDDGRRHR
jgi:hypothetical protein